MARPWLRSSWSSRFRTFPIERRIRLTIGYHGTAYAGWGVQPGQPTVQETLETALAQVLSHPARATAAGRTDAGVHADAQVVSLTTSGSIPAAGIASALATLLPWDVWIVDAADAPAGFDARRSALRRWYRYAIWRGNVPSSAWRGRCLPHPQPLDLVAMRRAASHLLGRHDFRGAATRPPIESTSDCTIFAADWLELDSLVLFEICADRFLTHMVRRIVGGFLLVSRGRWTDDQFATGLSTRDSRLACPNIPPIGLTLSRIEY